MSHFSVLVPASTEEQLEALLQPFHEYECTGVKDEHVIFIEEDVTECKEQYEQHKKDYSTFEEFMSDYYGYEKAVESDRERWGRWTNPNKKWDWWEIGGRWSQSLPLKKNGAKVCVALNKDIDWDALKRSRHEYAAQKWQSWHLAKTETDEHKRKSLLLDANLFMLGRSEVDLLDALTLEQYAEKASKEMPFWAFIDKQGNWNEKTDMGWWELSSNPKPENHDKFWRFIESLAPDQQLYVVDCHI